MIDLHTHSTASDGSFTPTQLVRTAHQLGLSAISLTDHDTVSGIDEMLRTPDVTLERIPGIELSATPPTEDSSVHLVGLYIDHRDPDLLRTVQILQNMRADRNQRLLDQLARLDIRISLEDLVTAGAGETIGRLHVARMLVERRIVRNIQDAFQRYIGPRGAAAVPKDRLSCEEAIQRIRQAGGVAILAHPDSIRLQSAALQQYIEKLVQFGLQGIEVFYSGYPPTLIDKFSRMASRYQLVRSGGSDFHGTHKPRIQIGRGTGSLHVHDSILDPIRALCDRYS